MKLKRAQIKIAMVFGFSTLTILAFQNCSKVDFAENEAAIFKAASTSEDSLRDPGVDPTIDPVIASQPPKGKDPESNQPKDKDDHTDDDKDASDSLVECELISPNQKIILDQLLKKGSNAFATRVCMSENACLKLINSYAAKRNCTLSLGASSLQDSEAQCTKIFPGSKGTCHNAGVISDEKVVEALDLMEKSK